MNNRVHLVLSAGGVRCISYAGAVTALVKKGISFASVSGASSGAFIGAILCSNAGLEGFRKATHDFSLYRLGEKAFGGKYFNIYKKPHAMYRKSRVADVFRQIVRADPEFKELA